MTLFSIQLSPFGRAKAWQFQPGAPLGRERLASAPRLVIAVGNRQVRALEASVLGCGLWKEQALWRTPCPAALPLLRAHVPHPHRQGSAALTTLAAPPAAAGPKSRAAAAARSSVHARLMQQAALVRLTRGVAAMRCCRHATAVPHAPLTAGRRALRVLAAAAPGSGPGSGAPSSDAALAEQRRRLIMQALARQHSSAAGAGGAAVAPVPPSSGAHQRPGMGRVRRILLSGAAAVALLAAATYPRPAAAFQLPGGGMFGGRPPVAEAAVADAVPAMMENKVSGGEPGSPRRALCRCKLPSAAARRTVDQLARAHRQRPECFPPGCRRRCRTCRSCRPTSG